MRTTVVLFVVGACGAMVGERARGALQKKAPRPGPGDRSERDVAGGRGVDGLDPGAVRAQGPCAGPDRYGRAGVCRGRQKEREAAGLLVPADVHRQGSDSRRSGSEGSQGPLRHEGLAQRPARRRASAVLYAGFAGCEAAVEGGGAGERVGHSRRGRPRAVCPPDSRPAGTSRNTSTSPAFTTPSS